MDLLVKNSSSTSSNADSDWDMIDVLMDFPSCKKDAMEKVGPARLPFQQQQQQQQSQQDKEEDEELMMWNTAVYSNAAHLEPPKGSTASFLFARVGETNGGGKKYGFSVEDSDNDEEDQDEPMEDQAAMTTMNLRDSVILSEDAPAPSNDDDNNDSRSHVYTLTPSAHIREIEELYREELDQVDARFAADNKTRLPSDSETHELSNQRVPEAFRFASQRLRETLLSNVAWNLPIIHTFQEFVEYAYGFCCPDRAPEAHREIVDQIANAIIWHFFEYDLGSAHNHTFLRDLILREHNHVVSTSVEVPSQQQQQQQQDMQQTEEVVRMATITPTYSQDMLAFAQSEQHNSDGVVSARYAQREFERFQALERRKRKEREQMRVMTADFMAASGYKRSGHMCDSISSSSSSSSNEELTDDSGRKRALYTLETLASTATTQYGTF